MAKKQKARVAPFPEHTIKLFPIYLPFPEQTLSFENCTILPGVTITRCRDHKVGRYQEWWERHPGSKLVLPNVLTCVDSRRYNEYLIEAIRADAALKALGFNVEKQVAIAESRGPHFFSQQYQVDRHVLTCMFLLNATHLQYAGSALAVNVDRNGGSHSAFHRSYRPLRAFPESLPEKVDAARKRLITAHELRRLVRSLDR